VYREDRRITRRRRVIAFLGERACIGRACIGHVRRFAAFTAALWIQMMGLMMYRMNMHI
jgi:hypothetical protein